MSHPHFVGRMSARNHQRIEIADLHRPRRDIGFHGGMSALAFVFSARGRSDEAHRRASRAQRFEWPSYFTIFELIFHQHGDPFTVERRLSAHEPDSTATFDARRMS